jgi:hypothetical protein
MTMKLIYLELNNCLRCPYCKNTDSQFVCSIVAEPGRRIAGTDGSLGTQEEIVNRQLPDWCPLPDAHDEILRLNHHLYSEYGLDCRTFRNC